MKYILYKDLIIASELSYINACSIVQKANQTKAADFFVFTASSGPNTNRWEVHARPKHAARAFVDNPEDFIVEH